MDYRRELPVRLQQAARLTPLISADSFRELPALADSRRRLPAFIGYVWRFLVGCNPNSRGEVFVIDDDAAARTTLAGALTLAGYEVTCFADGAGLLARAKIRIPLCVFLDVGIRDKCRFDLLDRISAEHWRAPVFASSVEASIPLAVDAVRRGAFDFIAKPFDGRDVVARVNAALGEISRTQGGIPTSLWDQAHLTGREWEVLERIALGENAKEIAQALGLSSRTVEGYRANILRKAGVRSTTELVRRVFGRCGRS
jgi:two-component system, LuxR family, response regulator FixJ